MQKLQNIPADKSPQWHSYADLSPTSTQTNQMGQEITKAISRPQPDGNQNIDDDRMADDEGAVNGGNELIQSEIDDSRITGYEDEDVANLNGAGSDDMTHSTAYTDSGHFESSYDEYDAEDRGYDNEERGYDQEARSEDYYMTGDSDRSMDESMYSVGDAGANAYDSYHYDHRRRSGGTQDVTGYGAPLPIDDDVYTFQEPKKRWTISTEDVPELIVDHDISLSGHHLTPRGDLRQIPVIEITESRTPPVLSPTEPDNHHVLSSSSKRAYSDEDSDEEDDRNASDEDYPDEIIEVPSAPTDFAEETAEEMVEPGK